MKLTIKSSIKTRNEYVGILWIGVLVFILSNAYFGWNKTAQSGAERVWDIVWVSLMFFGGISTIARSIVEEAHKDIVYDLVVDGRNIKEKV